MPSSDRADPMITLTLTLTIPQPALRFRASIGDDILTVTLCSSFRHRGSGDRWLQIQTFPPSVRGVVLQRH